MSGCDSRRINQTRSSYSLFEIVSINSYLRVHCHPKRFIEYTFDLKSNPSSASTSLSHSYVDNIIASSDDYVIVNKPPGLPVAATLDNAKENVIERVRESQLDPNSSSTTRISLWPTTRLDICTSGVLVLAKNKSFCNKFNAMIEKESLERSDVNDQEHLGKRRAIRKYYQLLTIEKPNRIGLVEHKAIIKKKHTSDDSYFLNGERKRQKQTPKIVILGEPDAKKTLEEFDTKLCSLFIHNSRKVKVYLPKTILNNVTSYGSQSDHNLVEVWQTDVELYTGRTHQIRAQFAAIGFPIIGDTLYRSDREDDKGINCEMEDRRRLDTPTLIALHAERLEVDINDVVCSLFRIPPHASIPTGAVSFSASAWWSTQAPPKNTHTFGTS